MIKLPLSAGRLAAAATAVTMKATAIMRPKQKKVLVFDRPFALLLCDTQTGAILFAGVIYDPIREELWQAVRGGKATLNNQVIQVSQHTQVSEAIVSVGFSKTSSGIERGMTILNSMIRRARKCRMLGSAALDLAYVATGRFDAYIEGSVNWWDIAAGALLVERAGGKVSIQPSTVTKGKLSVVATNGKMNLELPEES